MPHAGLANVVLEKASLAVGTTSCPFVILHLAHGAGFAPRLYTCNILELAS
jgi:hypothetical protein